MSIQDILEEAAVYKRLYQRTLDLAAVLQRCEQLQNENSTLRTDKANLETALAASKEQANSLLSERDQNKNDPRQ